MCNLTILVYNGTPCFVKVKNLFITGNLVYSKNKQLVKLGGTHYDYEKGIDSRWF